ncbi:plasmid pRiA4b ORF-3 family protein [Pseudomonas stutzeri]|nr:plasmid pRiA4b ORF-3 family protein [Stutzerimonas stutzeri]
MANHPVRFLLHVQLEPLHLNPPIWRRLMVGGDCSLRRLHHFIQAAMGWHSCHLHEFTDGLHRYLPPDADFPAPEALDDRKHTLRRLLQAGDRLRYVYDFGDAWEHVIAVEQVEACEAGGSWCEVLDGARACPPEDVGGVAGYLQFLDAIQTRPLADAGHEALAWAGGPFDAELFDRRAADAAVRRICNNFWG